MKGMKTMKEEKNKYYKLFFNSFMRFMVKLFYHHEGYENNEGREEVILLLLLYPSISSCPSWL